MESTIVIKVKYGDTLRRFNAIVLSEACNSSHMYELRAKICTLFNFPFNADLKMTYIDEDGDVVTLVGDDDLDIAIRQNLKFLRIDVELRNEKNKHPHSGKGITNNYSHPILGQYDFLWDVICDGCSAHSRKENLAFCQMCCTKMGIDNDCCRTTYHCGCHPKLPSPRRIHNQSPGLWRQHGSKPRQVELTNCSTSNDCLWWANKNNKELSSHLKSQCFTTTTAAATSTQSHPDACNTKLPGVSVVAPPVCENSSALKTTESHCIKIEEMRPRHIGMINDLLSNDYYSKYSLDSFDEHKWDAAPDEFEHMGSDDMAVVVGVLKKNGGNMKRTILDLIAREKTR